MGRAEMEGLRRRLVARDNTILDLRRQNDYLEADVERHKTALNIVRQDAARAEREVRTVREQLDAAYRTQDELIRRLADAASNSGDVVEKILTGIAPLFLGYREDAKAKAEGVAKALETEMGSLGLDDMAGVSPGTYFPDVEFDESMESRDKWPNPGTMTDPTKRADGQEMFRAGTTTSPPVSGVE